MKSLKLIGMLSLVWVLAACGSVENVGLKPEGIVCSPLAPSVSCPWGLKKLSSSKEDQAKRVAVGPDGSVFVLGETLGDLVGSGTQRKVFLYKFTTAGLVAWKIRASHLAARGTITPNYWTDGLAVDALGYAYVLYHQEDRLPYRYYLSNFDPNGNKLWAKEVVSRDIHEALALSPTGQPYVVGDSFIAKYSNDGTLIVDYPIPRLQGGDHYIYYKINDVTVDADGKIYTVGHRQYSVYPASPLLDIYDAWFNQVLNQLKDRAVFYGEKWLKVKIDSSGNIVVLSGEWTRGTLGEAVYGDHLIRFSPSSTQVWQAELSNDTYSKWFSSFALDSASYAYVVGSSVNAIATDAVISKYGSSSLTSDPLWTKHIPLPNANGYATDVATVGGYIYVVGKSETSSDSDGFLVRYDSSGNQR